MYKSAFCHLHSTFEGKATISGFCYEAAKAGVDVVWLSDHDTRIPGVLSSERTFIDYDFGTRDPFGLLPENVEKAEAVEWKQVETDVPDLWKAENASDGSALRLYTKTDGTKFKGASILTEGKNLPLISRPTILLQFDGNINTESEHARLLIKVKLSKKLPGQERSYLQYVLGAPVEDGHTIPMPFKEGQARLSLAEDAQRLGLGLDHHTREIEIRVESSQGQPAEVLLKHLRLEIEINDPYRLLQAQAELGKKIGREFGVDVVVGYEFSRGKHHVNSYAVSVPFFPYNQWQERPPVDVINRHAAKYDGITSYNHPFSSFKREELSEDEKLAVVDKVAQELISECVYGSQLIEIGYPEGRHGFEPAHYLSLWDQLNLAGLRICGIGVSDAHSNASFERGNNYANYIFAADPTLENLVAGLRSGNFYMADPHRLRSKVRFTGDSGIVMGGTQSKGYVQLELSNAPAGSELTWVLDGQSIAAEQVQGDCISRICVDEGKFFVRAQLCDQDGRIILLTNPIWLN